MKRTTILNALIVALSALSHANSQAQPPATKVVVAEARNIEARSTLTVVGTVEPVRRSRVGAEIAGLAAEMPVRQGDFVEAGQLLCKLDDRLLHHQLAAEESKLASLGARHEELLAGTRPEDLRRLEALMEAAAADYRRWKFEMERIERLFAANEANQKEFNETRAEYLRAERHKIAAEAEYNLGVEGPRAETKAQAAHDLAEQQAVVDRLKTELEKTAIRAPYTGFIVQRLVEMGEWIGEGDPVVEIVDLKSVLVRVDVPESAFPFVKVGDAARVSIDALGRSFDARVRHVMRQADQRARTFPIEIEIDNREGALAGGMFARATVAGGPVIDSVAVPRDALVERDGILYVALLIPGAQEGVWSGVLSPVTIGTETDGWIAVREGPIEPGTRVIVRGTERILRFPTPVQIVDEKGSPVAMPHRSPPDEVEASSSELGQRGDAETQRAQERIPKIEERTEALDGFRLALSSFERPTCLENIEWN